MSQLQQKLQEDRDAENDPYCRKFIFPGWNNLVTVCDEPSLFHALPEFTGWTKEQHEELARQYLILATTEEQIRTTLVTQGTVAFGDGNGQLISGCYRGHWPDRLKDDLRILAHSSTEYFYRSRAHWKAAGKRRDTWLVVKESMKFGPPLAQGKD